MKQNERSGRAADANKRAIPIIPTRRKLCLLLAMLLCSGIASAQVVVKGDVYGGGQGLNTDETAGLVTGNTWVTVNGGNVQHSIYGGGEFGSVGTFTATTNVEYDNGVVVSVPTECQDGTGLTKVIINGGKIGSFKYAKMPVPGWSTWEDSYGYIFAGGRGDADSIPRPLRSPWSIPPILRLTTALSSRPPSMAAVRTACCWATAM